MKLNAFKIRRKKQEHKKKGNERKGITELIMMVGFLLIFAIALITLIYIIMEGKSAFVQTIEKIKHIITLKK